MISVIVPGRASQISALLVLLCASSLFGCQRSATRDGYARRGEPAEGPASAAGEFRDVAQRAGITFRLDPGATGRFRFVETTPGGCAFLDYDDDGKLDIFLVQAGPTPGSPPGAPRPPCALYRNDGTHDSPHFTDVTHDAGLDKDFGYVQGVAVADYDNDGYPDIYLTAYGGNHLLHNESSTQTADGGRRTTDYNRKSKIQNRKYVDVTASAGVGDTDQGPRWATSAAWADYDGDGRLDLYVCHYCRWTPETDLHCVNHAGRPTYCTPTQYLPDVGRLYRNLGAGRFKDVSHESGIDAARGRGLGAIWIDYDDDGRPDLYVANDLNANLLFHNRGGGRFDEVGLVAGAAYGESGQALSGMGVAAADYDGDGREDLYVTNFSSQTNSLFRNAGGSLFQYKTQDAGLAQPTYTMLGWGVAFLDYDRDGWPDLVVGNGHVNPDIEQNAIGVGYEEPKGLYHNRGDGTFEDAAAMRGDMNHPRGTRGLAVGDFDDDGRPDVLANNLNGPAELFQNAGTDANHFLTIRLIGTRSNRDAIGAVVRVSAGGRTRMALCRRSSSYGSSCDPRLLFGLGMTARVDRIEIRWPSGRRDRFDSWSGRVIPVDTILTVTEGRGP